MTVAEFVTKAEMENALPDLLDSPKEAGTLEMIVIRPAEGEREVLETAELSLELGVVGDNWSQRPSSRTPDGTPHPDMQINLMNSRAIQLVAGSRERWPLAGDQLFVDLDISAENVPPGTRLALGTAVLEVTDQPHNGCKKFTARFGVEATRFFGAPTHRHLNLRGINAKVVQAGTISVGESVRVVR